MKKLFTFLALALIVELAVVTWLEYKSGRGAFRRETVADTVRVTMIDTVTYTMPVAKDSTIVRYVTVNVAKKDTAEHFPDVGKMIDSVEVSLPIEQKKYSDSTYTAYVSGYHPRLDSITVYPKREIVTIAKTATVVTKHRRLSIGLQAGYGVGLRSKQMEPYVGVGIGWRIF